MARFPLHNFAGRRALILHPSEEPRRRIVERCDRLGIRAVAHPGDPDADLVATAQMVILDIDTCDDGRLPWARGAAPVPVIGLVGSESPGRLAWALGQRLDAYLPLAALGNLFSALVIAHETFARAEEARRREAEAAARWGGRLDLIRAVLRLMEEGGDEAVALKQLRAMAMVERIPLEATAARVLARDRAPRAGRR